MEKILVDEDEFNQIASQKNVPSFLGKGKKRGYKHRKEK